jgi:Glu/Leu/Phe/Val dehydrogenase, dimerisation domain
MTVKCALAGLSTGGGKCVVLDHAGLDRARGFRVLGEQIAELGGLVRTAGDLGTTAAELAAMASRYSWVHIGESGLSAAVARGLLRCIEAWVRAARRRSRQPHRRGAELRLDRCHDGAALVRLGCSPDRRRPRRCARPCRRRRDRCHGRRSDGDPDPRRSMWSRPARPVAWST